MSPMLVMNWKNASSRLESTRAACRPLLTGEGAELLAVVDVLPDVPEHGVDALIAGDLARGDHRLDAPGHRRVIVRPAAASRGRERCSRRCSSRLTPPIW